MSGKYCNFATDDKHYGLIQYLKMMLRKIRLTLAIIFFGLVTLLFLDFTGTLHGWLSWMASIQFMPALLALNLVVIAVWIAVTLALGRVYCSVVCPLGVMQDVVSWISGKRNRKRKRLRFSYSPAKRWLRYTMLVLFIVALVAGIGAVPALLDPYSSYGRIAQNLFQPIYLIGNNALAYLSEHMDSYAFYGREVWIRSMPTFLIAAATFAILVVLAWRNGRTYCNTVCPVGTLLSFLARFSWMKVRIDDRKCVGCGLCAKGCKSACIDVKNHKIDYSRCVVCGDCLDNCHKDALRFGKALTNNSSKTGKADGKSENKIDSSRRNFLLAAATVTASAALAQEKKKVDGGLAAVTRKEPFKRSTPITPPGSISAQNMTRHCTACQLCVAECPNDVLRPSTDLKTLMQPTMSYDRGFCRPECHRCSEVCPAGAIKPIRREDKSSIQIGHAVWSKKNCIVFTDGVECGNCAHHCPTGAIMMIPMDGTDADSPKFPAVNQSRCIGCGACENLCPAKPFSAIHVEGHEVHKYI